MRRNDEAPDFSPGYPSKGAQIGPAWRAMWQSLSTGFWQSGERMAARIAEQTGIKVGTAAQLLRAARKAGVLEVEYRLERGRNRAYYRRK